jgi:hypothetical protein
MYVIPTRRTDGVHVHVIRDGEIGCHVFTVVANIMFA